MKSERGKTTGHCEILFYEPQRQLPFCKQLHILILFRLKYELELKT